VARLIGVVVCLLAALPVQLSISCTVATIKSSCGLLVLGGHKRGKPGILRDFSEHGKLREFSGNYVQPQGKIIICNNKQFLVCH